MSQNAPKNTLQLGQNRLGSKAHVLHGQVAHRIIQR